MGIKKESVTVALKIFYGTHWAPFPPKLICSVVLFMEIQFPNQINIYFDHKNTTALLFAHPSSSSLSSCSLSCLLASLVTYSFLRNRMYFHLVPVTLATPALDILKACLCWWHFLTAYFSCTSTFTPPLPDLSICLVSAVRSFHIAWCRNAENQYVIGLLEWINTPWS